jgi:hypothetical protein
MAVSEFSDGAKEEGVEMTKKDQAGRIADAIVELVERVDGPVTLGSTGRSRASPRRNPPHGNTWSSTAAERHSSGTE